MADETPGGEPPKKTVRRKPLFLLVPAGVRTVVRDGEDENETLYTLERFTSIVDLRKSLESREMDQTNVKGVVLFRADPIPVETKMRRQIVFKFGEQSDEDEEEV